MSLSDESFPYDLTVEIPVYGPPDALPDLLQRIQAVATERGLSWEVVLIDDGSPYGAWPVVERLVAEYPGRVRAIQLMRNFGQHNALMCGFRWARGRYILTMDDDGQHPPEEIPKLLEAIQQTGADVVYGVPRNRRHAWWRNLGAWLVIKFFQAALHTQVVPSAFRLLRRSVVEAITRYPYHFTHIDGLILWNTSRIAQVEVEHRPRQSGRSGYTFRKLLSLAFNVFTNFSLLPLQLASIIGFLAAAGGLLMGLVYLGLWLAGEIAVPGYASTIIAILVLGGLQLLGLGLIGEYLGRVHQNVSQRPQYTIRQQIPAPAAPCPDQTDPNQPPYPPPNQPAPYPAGFSTGQADPNQPKAAHPICRSPGAPPP